MPIVTETRTKTKVVAENMKWRKPRNQINITETDPNLQNPSLTQSTTCKSTISSLLLSTFSNNNNNDNTTTTTNNNRNHHHSKKKTNFSAASTFRGMGCYAGAPQEVSVPAMIRSSADWEVNKKKKGRKKKYNSTKNTNVIVISEGSSSNNSNNNNNNNNNNVGYVDFQDVWCGPGIDVEHVVTRKNVSSRGKIDVEKLTHIEGSSYLGRRPVTPETISFLDTDPDIFTASDSFGPAAPYYRQIQDPSSDDSSDGFAEILLQGSLLMGGRLTRHDRFRRLRLDIDNMTYEELLDLGERIGYVNAGLKEKEMGRNIRKIKFKFSHDASKNQVDKKCTICQEEYEAGDELGKLNCKHSYHIRCIRQWVAQKNFCPVCKQQVVARH